jgi:hypothetical protein
MSRPIIIDAAEHVACPKCTHRFPLSEGISRQAIERHAGELERSLAEHRKKLEAQLAAEAKAQYDIQIKAANDAVSAKESALAKFRAEELALRKQLRDSQESIRNQEVEYARRLDAERRQIEDKARLALTEEFSRKEAQFRLQMESVQRELADAKRKAEQGSQQLQGEALELSLEALLKAAFPLDEILPVRKGTAGADLVQRVRSPSGLLCGTILWEAKQTKAWQPAWLRKLKDEQREIGAELAVLVTSTMPKDRSGNCGEPFLRESDVWVTRFDAARPLAETLRAMLVEVHRQREANLGRAEKAEVLYNYLCSPQFAQRVKAVADAIAAARKDLDDEKAAMSRIWKKRDAQLGRMQDGVLAVVGDLQGRSESALPELDAVAALPAADLELAP